MQRVDHLRGKVAQFMIVTIVYVLIAMTVLPLQQIQAEESFDDENLLAQPEVDTPRSIGQTKETANSVTVAVYGKQGYTAKVVSISDGDTIKIEPAILGTDTVRLLSIDTPEVYDLGHDQEPHAGQATDGLKELLPIGTEIRLVPGEEEIDAYGRLLAHLYVGDLDVGKEMIRLGYAVPYFIAPNLEHFEDYRAAYYEAKASNRGIWSTGQPLEQLPYEFRFTLHGCPDKYVGDYETKKYVIPSKWEEIETGNRVFFFTKEDAVAAGYSPLDAADPDAESCVDQEVDLMTISEARGQQPGINVCIQGEVTAILSNFAWFDDGTAGIRLYGNETNGLTEGEEVEVVGTLEDFYGDVGMTALTITKLTGEDQFDLPEPKSFNSLADPGETDAGRLIQLRNVTIKEDYSASAGGIIMTDGTSEMIVYAQAGEEMKTFLQDLPKDKHYHFIGVAAMFQGNIQIFPRDESDIVEAQQVAGGVLTGRVLAEGRKVHNEIVIELVEQTSQEPVQYRDVVADDGTFMIEGLDSSVYEVRALLEHYIPVMVSNVTISSDQVADVGLLSAEANGGTSEGMMRAGDIVRDGVVDIDDAVVVGAHYEQTTEVALLAADVNGDGTVDSADLELVCRNMLHFTIKP